MGEAARVTLGPLDFDAFIPGWRTVWIADPDGVIWETFLTHGDATVYGDNAALNTLESASAADGMCCTPAIEPAPAKAVTGCC